MLSNSWVIVERETQKAICETFNKSWLDHLNTEKYEAIPAHEYLIELNRNIKKTKQN